jgi:para-aminobenzoate synthetase component 1
VVGIDPERVIRAPAAEALSVLDRLGGGWWAGFLAYDVGRAIEAVTPRLAGDPALPDLLLGRFDSRLVIDRRGVRVEGRGATRRVLQGLARCSAAGPSGLPAPALTGWASNVSQAEFEAMVHTAQAHITAGDCYQVNLTRRLTCPKPADPVALFGALLRRNPAPHSALLRFGDVAVVSASPESFIRRCGDRVETRPIKGTAADLGVLLASDKDRAENVMIVDLARNDLGRVCGYGTVRATQLCVPERHPGLYHLVSTVRGRLRPGTTTGALIGALFPPASITGAPKPRVLQIIEDLERCRRGVYCGAVGWIDADTAAMDLNVAIRTFVTTGSGTHLGVGAGIVADSEPEAEWRETCLKAARILAAATAGARQHVVEDG